MLQKERIGECDLPVAIAGPDVFISDEKCIHGVGENRRRHHAYNEFSDSMIPFRRGDERASVAMVYTASSSLTRIVIEQSETVRILQPVHVTLAVADGLRIGGCVEELPHGVSYSLADCLEKEGSSIITLTASSWDAPTQKTPSVKAESVSYTSKQLRAAVLLDEPFGEEEGGCVPLLNGVDVT